MELRYRFICYMKRIIQYIIWVLMGVLVSCQQPDLSELDNLPQEPEFGTLGKASFVMSAVIPGFDPATKTMGETPVISTFHLVVFDENGMFVEMAQAETIEDHYKTEDAPTTDNPDIPTRPNMDSDYIQQFRVVLTLTDQPRIIHFIANCPVDQIAYGHESSIISNLYVENGETAYWSRAEVPHIKVNEESYTLNGEIHRHPCEHLKVHLEYVHLLRNFAKIVVEDATTSEGDLFQLQEFTVYNTIHKGTVAPYNSNNQDDPFQCFVDWDVDKDGNFTGTGHTHTYQDFMNMDYPYEGHALSSAELDTDFPRDAQGNIIWYSKNNPFFMYERKVSVMTDEEEKWIESPPHVIVKALYDGALSYYKFDLVYNVMDETNTSIVKEIKYYNILRNFLYKFTITSVSGPGYSSPEEAKAGATSNNLAGSSEASKFTEVSVGTGAIAVSYTDTTVVNSGDIHLKYKYERRNSEGNIEVKNDSPYVTLENASNGDVIASSQIATSNITTAPWAGYRDVTLTIKEPGNLTQTQTIIVKTEDAKLLRQVRINLRKRLQMKVSCKPRIAYGIDVPQEVIIKLPPGMTEDMFPLNLDMEVKGLTLSPDASVEGNHLPVTSGASIINGKTGNAFHFTKTIITFAEYNNSTDLDDEKYRIVRTYWRTNTQNNASTIYVDNKYFEQANTSWINVSNAFSNVAVSTQNIPKGLDREVEITFTMASAHTGNNGRDVKIILNGLKNASGQSEFTIKPATSQANNISVNNGVVTISGLKTTTEDGKVGFSLECDDYELASEVSGERVGNQFTNYGFNTNKVAAMAGVAVDYTVTVPTHYAGMAINVTVDGLIPRSDDKYLEEVNSRSTIKQYVFKPNAAGTYTFKLQTVNKEPSICYIELEAERYYYTTVRSELNQAMAEFESFTGPNVIVQGEGRPVDGITFKLPNNLTNKTVNVTLEGLKRSSDNSSYFTVNTGNSSTYTLSDLVTTTVDGPVKVIIGADGITSATYEVINRTRGKFTNLNYSKNKLGERADEAVTLTFSMDAPYTGLPITVELDGLAPASGSLNDDGTYTYTVSDPNQLSIALKTVNNSAGTCSVTLKASGYDDASKSIEQSAATHALKATKKTQNNNNYDVQAVYQLGQNLTNGATYELTFYVKADEAINNVGIFLKKSGPRLDNNQNQQNLGNIGNVTAQWTQKTVSFTANQSGFDMIAFNIGTVPNGKSIYFDKVSLRRTGNNANPNEELITNGDFEDNINNFISNELNIENPPSNTWWLKTKTSVNPLPQCTLEIVTPGHE